MIHEGDHRNGMLKMLTSNLYIFRHSTQTPQPCFRYSPFTWLHSRSRASPFLDVLSPFSVPAEELCFSSGIRSLPPTYQSSLLKTMKPLLPRPKATWLLPLSHQFEKGWPSTTLRKITMFLKMQGMAVTAVARAPQPRGSWCKSHCFYCVLLRVSYFICRQRCSQTQPLPQVVSALIVTDFVDPSELLGGPIQSLASFYWKETFESSYWKTQSKKRDGWHI